MKDVGSDVPTDGTTEWTALSWSLPHRHRAPVQLACLLLCKGMVGAEVRAIETNVRSSHIIL